MKTHKHPKPQRRVYPQELKKEAVQMLLDGLSAPSVAHNLGIGHTSLVYCWKAESAPHVLHVPAASLRIRRRLGEAVRQAR